MERVFLEDVARRGLGRFVGRWEGQELRALCHIGINVVPSGELYELIAETFTEDPDFAYEVVICESSGNASMNTGNGYYGLWQFDLPTWQSVGGTGLPSEASVEEQIMRARMLYERRGWSPWGCA